MLSALSPAPCPTPSSASASASPLLDLSRQCLLGPGLMVRHGSSRRLVDPGEAGILKLMQAALPAEMAFSHALPALLSASAIVTAPTQSAKAGMDLDPDLDLARHAPLRLCLLANPAALYSRLSSQAAINSASACLDKRQTEPPVASSVDPNQTLSPPCHLPALTIVELLLGGGGCDDGNGSHQRTLQERVEAHAGCLSPPLSDIVWLLLRLSLDQQAFLALLKAGRQ